jgi:hypothetical protein
MEKIFLQVQIQNMTCNGGWSCFFLDLPPEKLYNNVNKKFSGRRPIMKNLTLILVCLSLLTMPVQAQQSKNPNHQIEEIEKYIASLHQGAEDYYTNQFIEVKQRAEAEIAMLEVADKVYAYLAEQAEVTEEVLSIDNYGYRTHLERDAKAKRMQQIKKDRRYGIFEDSIERAPERFAAAQSQIAERKSEILAKLECETADLEKQKNYALTVTLPELEKQLKEDMVKPEPKPTRGLVTGIVYSANKPCAVVDRKLVHEGDVISGITVVKISRDSIKFSKKNKNWEQKVQESSKSYW